MSRVGGSFIYRVMDDGTFGSRYRQPQYLLRGLPPAKPRHTIILVVYQHFVVDIGIVFMYNRGC